MTKAKIKTKTKQKKAKAQLQLVVEYRYKDGDVGVHKDMFQKACREVWNGFQPRNLNNGQSAAAFVVIRPDTPEAEKICTPLGAAADLQYACEKLVEAYQRGALEGGSVNWEDVDLAKEFAEKALAIVYGCPVEKVGERILPMSGHGENK